jgi:hypothetical protein
MSVIMMIHCAKQMVGSNRKMNIASKLVRLFD